MSARLGHRAVLRRALWPVVAAAVLLGAGNAAARTEAERLRGIRLGEIDVRDAHIGDTLDLLRESAEAADPRGAGVNLVYRGPPTDRVPRITLRLRNVSLYDALRYVTETAGLRFRIDERAVVITSADAPGGPLVTRFYPVTPAILNVVEQARQREAERRRERDEWW